MKVNLFDRNVFKKYGEIITWGSVIITFLSVIIPFPGNWSRLWAVLALVILFVLVYIGVWVWASKKKRAILFLHETKILIEEGDLFTSPGKKIIPFNEYFDTEVGNGIIDELSLNGQYIMKYSQKTPEELYESIVSQLKKRDKTPSLIDATRPFGKKVKYELGTIYDDENDFWLMAYSKFDSDNRAYLTQEDVLNCYINMWNEIDKLRGNCSIAIPLLGGSGLVRFRKDLSAQQLVELLLWSFSVSGIHLSRNATLRIVLGKDVVNDVNLLQLLAYSEK